MGFSAVSRNFWTTKIWSYTVIDSWIDLRAIVLLIYFTARRYCKGHRGGIYTHTNTYPNRSIGVSNFNIHHLEQLKLARPNHVPVVNQIELSPYLTRDEVVKYCQQEGIVVEAYSPLTKGQKLNDPVLTKIAQK